MRRARVWRNHLTGCSSDQICSYPRVTGKHRWTIPSTGHVTPSTTACWEAGLICAGGRGHRHKGHIQKIGVILDGQMWTKPKMTEWIRVMIVFVVAVRVLKILQIICNVKPNTPFTFKAEEGIFSQVLKVLFCLAGKQRQTGELFMICDCSQWFRDKFFSHYMTR